MPLRLGALVVCIASAMAYSFSNPVGNAFSPSSLLVSRIGRIGGLEPLSAPGSVYTYVDEYAVNGSLIQSVLVPALTLWTGNPMTCLSEYQIGAPVTLGLLTRSLDGTAVSINGPNMAAGTAYVSSTASSSSPEKLPWTFAFLNAASGFDTTTVATDHYAGLFVVRRRICQLRAAAAAPYYSSPPRPALLRPFGDVQATCLQTPRVMALASGPRAPYRRLPIPPWLATA